MDWDIEYYIVVYTEWRVLDMVIYTEWSVLDMVIYTK